MPPETPKVELGNDDGDGGKRRIFDHVLGQATAALAKEEAAAEVPDTPPVDLFEGEDEEGEESPDEDDDSEEIDTGSTHEEEESGDSEESDEEEEDEEELAAKDKDGEAKKKIQVKYSNGKTYNIPPDATISVKVDGETKEVSLRQVADEFSGRFVVDKELNKAKLETKKVLKAKAENEHWHTQLLEIDRLVTGAFEAVKKPGNDPISAIEAFYPLVEMAGQNPAEWAVGHINSCIDLALEISKMSEGERNALVGNIQVNYYKTKEQRRIDDAKSQAPRAQVQAEVKRVRSDHEIEDGEWQSAIDMLKAAKEAGKLADYGITEVTPRVAADLVLQARVHARVDGKLQELTPKLREKVGDEQFVSFRREMLNLARMHNLDDEDLTDIIREAAKEHLADADGSKDKKILGKKVAGARPLAQRTAKPKKKAKGPRTWKELDELIEREKRRSAH